MPNDPENPETEPDIREELNDIKQKLFGIREAVGTAIFFAFMSFVQTCGGCSQCGVPSADDVADRVIEKLEQQGKK